MTKRSPKFTKAKKKKFVELLASGATKISACDAVGIDYATYYRHTQSDEEFAQAVRDAEIRTCDPVVKALYEKAVKGNIAAIKYWLNNRWPEEWSERVTQNITSDDKEQVAQASLSLAERMLLASTLEKMKQSKQDRTDLDGQEAQDDAGMCGTGTD